MLNSKYSWRKAPVLGGLVCLALLPLFLIGCNSQTQELDRIPPDHMTNLPQSQGKYLFGITDTIPITFTEPIDTSALVLEFTPPEGIAYRFAGKSKLMIFGKNRTYSAGHFNINSPFSVFIKGLRDTQGNGQMQIEEKFQPYLWLDRDFVDSTFTGYDSLFGTESTWKDGSPITDSLVIEGSLDSKVNFGIEDRLDYKIIQLAPPDTLGLVLTTHKKMEIKMQIAGPFSLVGIEQSIKNNDFDSSFYSGETKLSGRLVTQFHAKYDSHDLKLGSPSKPGIYVIRLGIPLETEGFYRLGLKLRKLKR